MIDKLKLNQPPTNELLSKLRASVDFVLDHQYMDFILESNGASGFLNESQYLLLWEIDDVIALNPYYDDVEDCKELFFIGSDGSNLGYCYNKTNNNICAIDFLEIGSSQPEIVGENFKEFICGLSNKV